MISHSERAEPQKVTIEDLLRLKRSERPEAEFWQRFEQDLRAKQLAAIVTKRPWWVAMGLPQVARSVSRLQVPLGAAAVLALSFVAVREYRSVGTPGAGESLELAAHVMEAPRAGEGGIEGSALVATNDDAYSVRHAIGQSAIASRSTETGDESPSLVGAKATIAAAPVVATSRPTAIASGGLMEMIPWAAPVSSSAPNDGKQSPLVLGELPQAHFASAIVSWRDHRFDSRVEVEPVVMPVRVAASKPKVVETPIQTLSPSEVRRNRILSSLVVAENVTEQDRSRMGQVRDVLVSAMDDDRLYGSVRRLGMGGDRLTLKF